MKRILGIALVLGLVGALTVMAQEVKHGKVEVIDLGKDVKLEMVLIPAGKFKMGSPASEVGRRSDEKQHEVTLTKPYYMGKYEVTQEQWEAVMGNNPSVRTKGARLPVTDISWNDCQEFIKKLNTKTNKPLQVTPIRLYIRKCFNMTTKHGSMKLEEKILPTTDVKDSHDQ